MGIISVDLFITLDGVYQAPGGPDEDREGGFAFGGWQAPYFDDESGEAIGAGIDRMDALLLGRKTYDIFASFWPDRGEEDPIASTFNALPKFVVSRSLTDPSWDGTTVLSDAATDVRALNAQSLLITGPADASTLAKVSAWCEEHGVLPESLSMGQRTLEDVFLQLTGRELVP